MPQRADMDTKPPQNLMDEFDRLLELEQALTCSLRQYLNARLPGLPSVVARLFEPFSDSSVRKRKSAKTTPTRETSQQDLEASGCTLGNSKGRGQRLKSLAAARMSEHVSERGTQRRKSYQERNPESYNSRNQIADQNMTLIAASSNKTNDESATWLFGTLVLRRLQSHIFGGNTVNAEWTNVQGHVQDGPRLTEKLQAPDRHKPC